MGEFKKFGAFKGKGGFKRPGGDRPRFGGGRPAYGGGRDRDRGERSEMFEATCDQCGKQCEVPFRPSGSKPVFCNNCFGAQQGDQRPSFDRPRQDRFEKKDRFSFGASKTIQSPSGNDKQLESMEQQLNSLHEKIDALTQLLRSERKATSEKPVAPATAKTEPTFALIEDKKEARKKSAKKAAPATEAIPATKKKVTAKKK